MEYFDDDENVKAMRETARTVGLTDLLTALRHDLTIRPQTRHVDGVRITVSAAEWLAKVDKAQAQITRALELLGVADDGRAQ